MGKYRSSTFSKRAFTLVEVLAVVGIMATMMAMVVPSVSEVMNSRGRRGAINIVMNAAEQARVLALESSTNVYLGFADKNMPSSAAGERNEGFPYTRFIVFRDYNADSDPAPPAGQSNPQFVALTKWQQLPKGVSFRSDGSTITSVGNGGLVNIAAADHFPSIASHCTLPVLQFNSTGAIQMPAGNLWLYLYEGYYSGGAAGSEIFTRASNGGLFERISFSRYTGRAQLDITSIPTT